MIGGPCSEEGCKAFQYGGVAVEHIGIRHRLPTFYPGFLPGFLLGIIPCSTPLISVERTIKVALHFWHAIGASSPGQEGSLTFGG